MRRVLSLATYPVRQPQHGGQRRVAAFREAYGRLGIAFHSACVYEAPHFKADEVGADDLPLGPVAPRWRDLPFVSDLASGEFAAERPAAYEHFRSVVERLKPDALQLEHPFLWPLVKRLLGEPQFSGLKLIYSSHNWEGPLKEEILLRSGVSTADAAEVGRAIERMEAEVLARADITAAVSASDAAVYRRLRPEATVLVVANGVNRPPPETAGASVAEMNFGTNRFLFFVGSAYPPNLEGFSKLVTDMGLFFTPPLKSLAVCGGVSDLIFHSASYQRFIHANSERVHFFPRVSDADLSDLKRACHAVLLPIQFGGGSNLKTAEALASGRWMVTTSTALRGFEAFEDEPGILTGDTPKAFRQAMIEVLRRPPLQLSPDAVQRREAVYWDRAFADGGFEAQVKVLLGGA